MTKIAKVSRKFMWYNCVNEWKEARNRIMAVSINGWGF